MVNNFIIRQAAQKESKDQLKHAKDKVDERNQIESSFEEGYYYKNEGDNNENMKGERERVNLQCTRNEIELARWISFERSIF